MEGSVWQAPLEGSVEKGSGVERGRGRGRWGDFMFFFMFGDFLNWETFLRYVLHPSLLFIPLIVFNHSRVSLYITIFLLQLLLSPVEGVTV